MTGLDYPALFVFIYLMNLAPALMPPTWIVLAFFYIHFNLLLLPVVILGASAATLGRVTLAILSRKYFRRVFSEKSLQNYDTLGRYANTHRHLTMPAVFCYSFLPIPSNQLFIIAGLSGLNIKMIALSFLGGRLLSDTFWVSAARVATDRLDNIFSSSYSQGSTLVVEVIGLAIIYFVGKINWQKLLRLDTK